MTFNLRIDKSLDGRTDAGISLRIDFGSNRRIDARFSAASDAWSGSRLNVPTSCQCSCRSDSLPSSVFGEIYGESYDAWYNERSDAGPESGNELSVFACPPTQGSAAASCRSHLHECGHVRCEMPCGAEALFRSTGRGRVPGPRFRPSGLSVSPDGVKRFWTLSAGRIESFQVPMLKPRKHERHGTNGCRMARVRFTPSWPQRPLSDSACLRGHLLRIQES